jgi:putative endonuclease
MITVYVLKGKKRYIGITNNLERRLAEHRRKSSKGSQAIGEFKLIHAEQFTDYKNAREREKYLKSGASRAWLDKLESGQSQPEAGKSTLKTGG